MINKEKETMAMLNKGKGMCVSGYGCYKRSNDGTFWHLVYMADSIELAELALNREYPDCEVAVAKGHSIIRRRQNGIGSTIKGMWIETRESTSD